MNDNFWKECDRIESEASDDLKYAINWARTDLDDRDSDDYDDEEFEWGLFEEISESMDLSTDDADKLHFIMFGEYQ